MASLPLSTGTTSALVKSPSPPLAESAPYDSAIEVSDAPEATVDDVFDTDTDPGYATDNSSTYTASITSSVRQHVYEGGLRYHAFRDGKYAFPNDETEQNRDDMKHAMTLLLCDGKLHYAPIGANPLDIIDLGTGTGIWAIESSIRLFSNRNRKHELTCTQVAEQYPSASVIGLDLSPIQPTWVPPNLKFVVDDIEDLWLHPKNHFDYVHVRHVVHSIKNRPLLISRALRHLKPGGYIEFQELNYTPHCDDDSMVEPYVFRHFMEDLRDGMTALGNDLNGATKLFMEVSAAGFEGVNEIRLKCPVGVWPKDRTLKLAGLYWRTAIMDGLNGLANRSYGKGLKWSREAIEVFLVDVRKSLMDTSKHTYFPLHIVYGQKPLL